MQLVFCYPDNVDSLEILLATHSYAAIWQESGPSIIERFAYYTGLQFQQKEIVIVVHDGQSMSGKNGVPMRLNMRNYTLIQKRNALTHELAHRLLFGNNLYAPAKADPVDNDEIRVMLFQGEVIHDIYGKADYSFWAGLDPNQHNEDYVQDLRYVLSLSKQQRIARIKSIIDSQLKK